VLRGHESCTSRETELQYARGVECCGFSLSVNVLAMRFRPKLCTSLETELQSARGVECLEFRFQS